MNGVHVMTWIDWATLTCVVCAALLWTMVAIRQQLRIRGERELLRCQQRHRAAFDWLNLASDPTTTDRDPVARLKQDLATPAAEPGIQAGDSDRLPNCAYPGAVKSAAVFRWAVALNDSQPVDPHHVDLDCLKQAVPPKCW